MFLFRRREIMDVPAIGKAKGLFEIFIPGVFLLLNFVWMLYYLQYQDWRNFPLYDSVKDNQILMLIIIIVFGYLTGVILWLFRADIPDKISARLRKFWGASEKFYKEDFPYIDSFGSIAEEYLPREAISFYKNCWEPRKSSKYFFNYCKVLINAVDEKSAIEIYSSEALIRYLAAMFYALLISILFLGTVILFPIDISKSPIILGSNFTAPFLPINASMKTDSYVFLSFYFASIIILLWHFRYMRFKEVQTVFTASLINRKSIGLDLCDETESSIYEIEFVSKL